MKLRNKPTVFFTVLVLLCAAGNVYALGGTEKTQNKVSRVEVSGTVRLVGSSPMTYIVITGETREWYIDRKEQNKLMNLQQQIITVRGDEYCEDLVYANGISAERRYYLKNITVIKPKK